MTSRRDFLYAAGVTATSVWATNASAIPSALAPPDKQPVALDVPSPPKKTIGFAVVGLRKTSRTTARSWRCARHGSSAPSRPSRRAIAGR